MVNPSRGKLPLKGIYRNTLTKKFPDGFTPDVYNMVANKKTSVFNTEPGNIQVSNIAITNNLTIIGIKDILNGGKILMSINNNTGLDEIGLLDVNYNYSARIQANLGFNINYAFAPSNMQVEYNFQGDLILAFTDNLNSPKIVDLTNPPNPFTLSQIELFPSYQNPICDSEVIENGGAVLAGTYYPCFRYTNNDGTSTGYTMINNPVYVVPSNGTVFANYFGSAGGAATTKSLQFNLTNVDTDYDFIVLALLYKSNGQFSAFEVGQVNTGATVSINYTGSEAVSDVAVTAITTPPGFYTRVGHLTTVQGTLYGADVSEESPIDLQPYASLISLKFQSTLLGTQSVLQNSYKVNAQNNKLKGYCHQEVYAFYLIAKLKGGGWTQPVHIPGRPSASIDGGIIGNETDLNSTLIGQDSTMSTDIAIDSNSKYYQTRDTTRDINTGTGIGTFGFWQNEDEVYPNTDSFNSSSIGGEDLRGQPVRHHRFPSIKKCKETLYSSNGTYGINTIDVLSLIIDSFPTIPDDILDQIEGFQIMYAERSYANMTVAGNDIVLNGGRRQGDNTGTIATNPIYTSGGNWTNNDLSTSSSGIPNENIIPYQSWLRLHSFNLLLNKPSVSPAYLSNHFILHKTGINTSGTLQFDDEIVESYYIDYGDTGAGTVTTSPLTHTDEFQFAINNYRYVPNNVLDGQINNYRAEAFIFAQITAGNNRTPYTTNTRYDTSTGTTSPTLTSEATYYTSIMLYRKNIYNSFYSQSLASTGIYFLAGNTPSQVYGGDSFVGLYSFLTFAPITLRDIPNSQKPYSGPISVQQGVKVLRQIICEATDNIGFRYQVTGDPTTYFFPATAVEAGNAWFLEMAITTDPNNITYDKDFSSVNDLNPFVPLNPFAIFEADHPFRIFRSTITSPSEQALSWRTFLANDFIEIRKDMGPITNIQGIGFDLLINLQRTILQTIANQTINTNTPSTTNDTATAYVGTGDIFARPPMELRTALQGVGGCQHRFSCLLTPMGYFFADVDASKAFLYTGGELKEITAGLYFEFLENLVSTGDNPYINTGLTVAWDSYYERIIFCQLDINPFVWSYTPEKESWTSRHGYSPQLLFNDRTGFYSLKNNIIYKHNADNKATYYEEIQPSWVVIVDRILPPKRDPYEPRDIEATGIDQIWTGINWKTEIILNGIKLKDKTLDQVLCWTGYQSTGNIAVQAFDTTKTLVQNSGYNARRIKDRWIFNQMRDNISNHDESFIDENYNSIEANINRSKSFIYKKRLADDFLVVKLLFTNQFIGNFQPDCYLTDFDTEHNPIVR